MERAEAGEMDLGAVLGSVISDLERATERRRALVAGVQIANQINAIWALAHPLSLSLYYDLDLRIVAVGGEGWVIDAEACVGKTIREAFGADHGAALEPHYRAGLAGHHEFDFDFEGDRWRSVLRPLVVVGIGCVGGVLLSRPLSAWERGGDPTQPPEEP